MKDWQRYDIVSTLPLGIILIVLISIIVVAAFIGLSILCCCFCCKCCQGEDLEDEDEDRPLLGSKYLRRSSTYYQWNRQPVVANKTDDTKNAKLISQSSSVPVGHVGDASSSNSATIGDNWVDRRTALLKKYAREPTPTNEWTLIYERTQLIVLINGSIVLWFMRFSLLSDGHLENSIELTWNDHRYI